MFAGLSHGTVTSAYGVFAFNLKRAVSVGTTLLDIIDGHEKRSYTDDSEDSDELSQRQLTKGPKKDKPSSSSFVTTTTVQDVD